MVLVPQNPKPAAPDHKTLYGLLRDRKTRWFGIAVVAVIGLFIAVVTLARLLAAYDGFLPEAFSGETGWWILLLVVVNILVIGAVIAVLVALLKPPKWYAYVFVVVLSFPVIVAAPIGVATITGDVPGNPQSVKLSDVYNPWESWIRGGIDKPVTRAKRREIDAVVATYRSAGAAGSAVLLDRLDAGLSAAGATEDAMETLQKEITATLDARGRYAPRLRKVARTLYAAGQRRVVQELAALPRPKRSKRAKRRRSTAGA